MSRRLQLRERFIAASFYCQPEQVATATQLGNTAVENLIQILEYFPDKLKVNDMTPDQKKFVLSALDSVSRNIDGFLALMPQDQVTAPRPAPRPAPPARKTGYWPYNPNPNPDPSPRSPTLTHNPSPVHCAVYRVRYMSQLAAAKKQQSPCLSRTQPFLSRNAAPV